MLIIGTDIRIQLHNGRPTPTHPSLTSSSIERLSALGGSTPILVARKERTHSRTDIPPLDLLDQQIWFIDSEGGPKPVRILRAIVGAWKTPVTKNDTVYVRLPETIGIALGLKAAVRRATLVPHIVAFPDALIGESRGLIPKLLKAATSFIISKSALTLYVTQHTLQDIFPPGNSPTHVLSNVQLTAENFIDEAKTINESGLNLITIGSLNGTGKGMDTTIRALDRLRAKGINAKLDVVGTGSSMNQLLALTKSLSLGDHVTFTGQLAPSTVRERIDSSDIFILSSRSEGLPRSMIEAMARGVVCLGTEVGGIPELLDPEQLFPPGDYESLCAKIEALYASPSLALNVAQLQLDRARQFEWGLSIEKLRHAYREAVTTIRK